MGELKILNTSQIKYSYGVIFQVKTIGKVYKEKFFGREKKVKKPCHKKGELYQGGYKIMEFEKFHSFQLDVFRLNNKYYILSKIDNLFGLYDISNKSNVKFTKHTFVPEQFKTNGENKLILIINKEILYLKINLVEDSIKYILVDKISDFKSDKGIWLDINWESKLSFDTMLVNCKNNKVSRNEYDRYQRMILKVRLDKDKMTYIKSFVEPSN